MITVGIAAAVAFSVQNDDPNAAPTAPGETPSAAAAATAASKDDVITPAPSETAGASDTGGAAGESPAADDGASAASPAAPSAASDPNADSADAGATDTEGSAAAGEESAAGSEDAAAQAATLPVTPAVAVTPSTVEQGRATLVVLSGDVSADRVFVSIDGYTGEMVFEDDTGWVGFVPVSPLTTPRRYNVVVDTFDDDVYRTTFLGELFVQEVIGEIEQITLDPDTAALLAPELVAIDNQTRFEQYVEANGPRLWSLPWRLPVSGEQSGDFGVLRSYNGGPASDWHHGHDIDADAGAPIVAPAPGRVVFATELTVHGLGVILDHGAGVYSGYWHMSQIDARVGDLVQPGARLGLVGETGVVTGPHLHWEVIVQGRDVDPLQWTELSFR